MAKFGKISKSIFILLLLQGSVLNQINNSSCLSSKYHIPFSHFLKNSRGTMLYAASLLNLNICYSIFLLNEEKIQVNK